ncbi:hypothetical protein FWF89_01460 [Candidatus Saccharibacteria bacterium]|nr:hypothetical protein [Candidatus Saccharibacteria bacterium]
MARDPYADIFKLSAGHELETQLIDVFGIHFTKKGKVLSTSEFRFATSQEDRELGTDAFIYGLPCDFTCNFAGKNHMIDLHINVDLPGIGLVRFGVRTGNGRVKFETPVLVIGIETEGYFSKSFIPNIIDSISHKIDDIINVGQEAYWNCCDELNLA